VLGSRALGVRNADRDRVQAHARWTAKRMPSNVSTLACAERESHFAGRSRNRGSALRVSLAFITRNEIAGLRAVFDQVSRDQVFETFAVDAHSSDVLFARGGARTTDVTNGLRAVTCGAFDRMCLTARDA